MNNNYNFFRTCYVLSNVAYSNEDSVARSLAKGGGEDRGEPPPLKHLHVLLHVGKFTN